MLSFVQNMLGPKANPIGVDFGTDTLRLVQVAGSGDDLRVIASASADIPSHIRNDTAQRLTFFSKALRELLAAGSFKGRNAVLGLPSAGLSIVHVRVPVMDEAAMKKAIPFEARGKLPYDPSHALVRHLIAGEVYSGQEPKLEAIVMASPRNLVEGLLAAAGKAKLDVVGISTEPQALMDCYRRFNRSREDREAAVCYVDIGASGSRVIIALNGKVMFARAIPVGGDQFTRAVAQAGKIGFEDARLMRHRIAEAVAEMLDVAPQELPALAPNRAVATLQHTEADELDPAEVASAENSFAILGASMARKERAGGGTAVATPPKLPPAPPPLGDPFDFDDADAPAAATPPATGKTGTDKSAALESRLVETSVREPLSKLVAELEMCRSYHEATFPSAPVQRLVFVGGEARHKSLCSYIARELGIAATVGDPLARMSHTSTLPDLSEGALDRRGPQPSWSVALGLSIGAVGVK